MPGRIVGEENVLLGWDEPIRFLSLCRVHRKHRKRIDKFQGLLLSKNKLSVLMDGTYGMVLHTKWGSVI